MPAPDPDRRPPEKFLFAVRNTLPPRGRQQGAGGRGGWVAGGWWLGGWVAGGWWLVAGGWLAGWLGKGKVIGFDYYVMS